MIPFVSSLSLINQKIASVLLLYLQSLDPNINTMAISSSTDIDTDFHRLRTISSNNTETLPAAVISRTNIQRFTGLDTNPSKYQTMYNKGANSASLLRFIPVKISYNIRIHTTTYEEAEFILEQLTIFHNPESQFNYTIPNIDQAFSAKYELSLLHNEVRVSNRSQKDKEGYIYTTAFNCDVYGLLVTQPSVQGLILHVVATVYDKDTNVVYATLTDNAPSI
jgi:hypothetical protein